MSSSAHTPPANTDLAASLHHDRHLLSQVDFPLITVSATFRQDIAQESGEKLSDSEEVVFSRAHFSMAVALFVKASQQDKTAWIFDPTNFVSRQDWGKVLFTEFMGEFVARHQLLKDIKDKIDTLARNKLPITSAITPPLLYATKTVTKPLLSLHYEAGNILVKNNHRVVQVITDPHVRDQYLKAADSPNVDFCVFDAATKEELLQKALELKKSVDPRRIHVTGSPIDPRIIKAGQQKPIFNPNRPTQVGITTGGLGTNKDEIKKILEHIFRHNQACLKDQTCRLLLYAGTHKDFYNLYQDFAQKVGLKISPTEDKEAVFRIIYADDIVAANEQLIQYFFPWVDLVITKPSGDMAYDAAASGAALVFLEPWGPWEKNVRDRFVNWQVAQIADSNNFGNQIKNVRQNNYAWLISAQTHARNLPDPFYSGTKNILSIAQNLSKNPT